MIRWLSPALGVLALTSASAGGTCSAVFSSPDTIAAGDLTFEGCDVVVDGTTLVVVGVHAFASLTVRAGGLVTSLPRDSVTLSVLGSVQVDSGGRISVDGRGHPIGQGPGAGGAGNPASGGAHGGRGGSVGHLVSAPTYGSLFLPATLGSGGGISGLSSASGGGVVRLAVGGVVQVDGSLSARGDSATTVTPSYSAGGGAGGSIHVSAASLIGSGRIDAGGGRGFGGGGGGGGGRIAIDASFAAYSGSLTACGGSSSAAGRGGAAGTLWTKAPEDSLGTLSVAGCGLAATARTEAPDSSLVVPGHLEIRDSGRMGARVGVPLRLEVTGDLHVEPGCALSADGSGHPIGVGPGSGAAGDLGSGGSYGGRGGGTPSSGPTYGSLTAPTIFGSGGGVSGVSRAHGGGAMTLQVGGVLHVDGEISARGDSATSVTPSYSPGGGSGGSILATAGMLQGSGRFDSGGGKGWNQGGGGGGGRIAIEFASSSFTGELVACGAPAAIPGRGGAAGTTWTRDRDEPLGVLGISNCGRWTLARTDLPETTLTISGSVEIAHAAIVGSPARTTLDLTVSGDFSIEHGAALSMDGLGYPIGQGPGAGGSGGFGDTPAGGSHGGRGGYSTFASAPTYGSDAFPSTAGSGGGLAGISTAGGGGVMALTVAGRIRIDGSLSARGDSARTLTPGYAPGGGAGGSLRVRAGVISGSGAIDASGGPGLAGGGGGGGGRVAIESLCWDGFSPGQIRVAGGSGGSTAAEPGSVWPAFEIGIAGGVVSTTGPIRRMGPPLSLMPNASPTADSVLVLKERGGLLLEAPLGLDITAAGPVGELAGLTPGIVPSGTWIDSHLLHFDPQDGVRVSGSVSFDTNVLGLVVTRAALQSSDPPLHAPSVDYPTDLVSRGIELGVGADADTLEIAEDLRTVRFSLRASDPLDQVRVITAVPLATCGPVLDAPTRDTREIASCLVAPPFPNPSRGHVALRFALSAPARARLDVFDVSGRFVARLADDAYSAGWHSARWAAPAETAAGIYFARLTAGTRSASIRFVMQR